MISLLLIDDHALVRTGIKRLLEDRSEVQVIGEAESGEEGVRLAVELNPDVILLDVKMPGIGGVEACRRILVRNPGQRVIILSIHDESTFPKRLLEIGAKGYLSKDCQIDEILLAIKSVFKGESYIAPKIAQQLALSMLPGNDENPLDRLSKREFQVMLMFSHGYSNTEISERLNLSPKTISTYRARLLEKLGVASEIEMIRIAIEHGIVAIDQTEA